MEPRLKAQGVTDDVISLPRASLVFRVYQMTAHAGTSSLSLHKGVICKRQDPIAVLVAAPMKEARVAALT